MNPFITDIRTKAAARPVRAALPDAEDVRVLQAAASPPRPAPRRSPCSSAPRPPSARSPRPTRSTWPASRSPTRPTSPWHDEFAAALFEKRKAKGLTREQAADAGAPAALLRGPAARHRPRRRDRRRQRLLDRRRDPGRHPHRRRRAGHLHRQQLLHHGAARRPAALLRRLRGEPRPERRRSWPTSPSRSARNFQAVAGLEPRVAMLSFSTKGQRRRTRTWTRCGRRPASCGSARRKLAGGRRDAGRRRAGAVDRRAQVQGVARRRARRTCWCSPTSTPATSATS